MLKRLQQMEKLIYPVIVSEYNDDGHYYVVTSPNIKGLVTQGDTFNDAVFWAEDAIATMLDGQTSYPTPEDPSNWQLKSTDRLVYVEVDMKKWLVKNSKTIQRTITVPEYLSEMAKEKQINVSRVTTEALKEILNV